MVWGKPHRERRKEKEGKKKLHRWFAWWPVVLNDGRITWLQTVQRRFVLGLDGIVEERYQLIEEGTHDDR